MVPTTWLRSACLLDEGSGEAGLLGPGVEDLGRAVAARRRPLQAAVGVHPVELLGQEEDGGQRRRVVGLVQHGVVDRGLEVEEGRDPAARRGDPLDPLERGRRHQGDPEAAVGRRSTSAGRSSRRRTAAGRPAARRRPRWRRRRPGRRPPPGAARRRSGDRHGDTGRGLVVGQRVEVDRVVGPRERVRAHLGLDDLGVLEVRAPPSRTRRTSRRTRRSSGAGSAPRSRPNVAASQKQVVPPLPRTTS